MSIQNNPNAQQLSLDAFQSMAGTEKSTGFLGIDSKGNLTKAAAHRTLTGFNKSELAKLQNNPRDNQYIRTSLFNAVKSHLAHKAESTDAQRIAALKFVAQKLGMAIDVKDGLEDVKIRGVSDQPLERREIRSIINVTRSSKLQSILVPDESDTVHTAQASERREALLSTMKAHFKGIRWKDLPLGQLTNESLRFLGENLIKGTVKTWPDFKAMADELAKTDSQGKINDESVLQRLERAKDHATEQVSFKPPKKPKDVKETFIYKQSEADTTKFLPKEGDQASLDEEGNSLSLDAIHEKQEKALKIPSEKSVDSSMLSMGEGMDISKIIKGKNGEAEMVVSHFIESFIATAADKDGDMQAMLLGHKRALAVIVGCSQARFDALFESIPNGALMKEAFAKVRESALTEVSLTFSKLMKKSPEMLVNFTPEALSKKGLDALTLGKFVDEVRSQLTDGWDDPQSHIKNSVEKAIEAVNEQLNLEVINAFNALADDSERVDPMMADLRQSLSGVLQAHRNDAVETTAKALIATLLENKHAQALTLLLCHTDKTLASFGNEALLRPVVDGLKAKLNGMIKADLVQEGTVGENDTVDFFRPEFVERVQEALTTKLAQFANDPTLFAGIEGSVLTEGQVGSIVLDSVRMLFDTLTSASNAQLTETTHAVHDVKEEHVRNLLADLFLEKETWVSDEEAVPGTRLQQMFSKDLDTLAVILCNPEKCAETLGFGEMIKDTLETVKESLKPLDTLFAPGNEAFARIALGKIANTLTIEQFATMQEGIDTATQKAMGMLQTLMGSAFEALLHGEDVGNFDEILQTAQEDEAYVKQCKDSGMDQAQIDAGLQERHIERADAKEFQKSIEGLELTTEQVETRRAAFNEKKAAERDHAAQLKTLQGEALVTYVAQHKAQGEAEFNEKLDAMTLTEGFELWAKRECYTKESRAALKEKLFSEKDPGATILSIRGESSFTQFMNAYIAENNLRPTTFKEPDTMSPQEKAVWLLEEAELEEITGKGALDTSSGYGKFMVEVMKSYFAKVSTIDKKSMIASLIRQGKVIEPKDNATPEEREQLAKDNLARQLGALFKGAGPVMQKLLQQLGSTEVSKEFKLALQDMKMNLLPIPLEVVAVQLQSVVDDYNKTHPEGKIASMNVDKSLGAASVGQTLLCTVTFEDGSSRPVAVKLLRPDAQNRIDREKDIFLEVARTVPGMEQTYLGRLERVLEEVDLTIEAANVEKGKVYDKPLKMNGTVHTDVKSMKLDPTIQSTRDIMVLECAPGVTVAELLQENDAKLQRIMAQANQLRIAPNNAKLVQELDVAIAELEAKQQQLVQLSHKWVEEGLFKSGFYHGDLHAGNIMVDRPKNGEPDKGLTVIDFGNATALSKDDQGCIMRMVYGAGNNDAKLFLDNYRSLLKPESLAHFDAVRAQAQQRLEAIFKKGDGDSVGQCILAAVTELQKLDLELPAQIFNFSQCQILLQGTLEQVNTQLAALRNARVELWNRNNPMSEEGVTEGDHIRAQILKNLDDPEALSQMRQLLEARANEYKAQILEFLNENPEAIPNFLAEDATAREKYEVKFQALALNADALSDVETLQWLRNLINDLKLWALNVKGYDWQNPIVNGADRVTAYCDAVRVWQQNKANLEEFATLSHLQTQVNEAKQELDGLNQQLYALNDLISEITQLGEGVVVPENALTLEDKAIARLLKGKNSKAEMMAALNVELTRLRQLAKPTEEEQALFETVKKFHDALAPMPENYLPRPKLAKVEKASFLIADTKPNHKAGLLAKFQSMKTEREAQIQEIKAEAVYSFATQENIQLLKTQLAAVKAMEGNEDVVIDFVASEAIQQIHAAWSPRNPAFPTGQTKAQMRNLLEAMIRTLSDKAKKVVDLQKEITERLDPAIEEISTTAKNWPDNTPMLTVPKVPSNYIDMLQGQPMTRENLLALLEPIRAEVRERDTECSNRYQTRNLELNTGDVADRLTTLCSMLGNADSFFEENHAPNPNYENPKSFLKVMGGVISNHKIKSAMAVGLGTAIKALFS